MAGLKINGNGIQRIRMCSVTRCHLFHLFVYVSITQLNLLFHLFYFFFSFFTSTTYTLKKSNDKNNLASHIIMMKNCNRRDSHCKHGSKRRELTQHAHSHGSHALTHTLTTTQLQPRGAKRQLSYYFSVHAGSFRVSVIHRTVTWTADLDHYCACVYIQRVSTTFLTRKLSE